jgi:hypothetical protein
MILDVIECVCSFTILWHVTFSPSGLKVILPRFRAKAIRLKAKVLDRAHGNKKVKGRKRHLLVDTLGNLLEVVVLAANRTDVRARKPY